MSLNLLLSSILCFASPNLAEVDGWTSVEKVSQLEAFPEDIDPSIWVVFAKRVGEEVVSVRFPEDPVASRTPSGGMLFRSEKDGEIFELVILSASEDFQGSAEKWVHEHVMRTDRHTYLLRTVSDLPGNPHHAEFVSSLKIIA